MPECVQPSKVLPWFKVRQRMPTTVDARHHGWREDSPFRYLLLSTFPDLTQDLDP
jgi:hypothetical protein